MMKMHPIVKPTPAPHVVHGNESTTLLIILAVVVVIILAAAALWKMNRGSTNQQDESGRIVLLAFGREWSRRFSCPEEELGKALTSRTDSPIARRVDAETGVADLRYAGQPGGSGVATTIDVTYSSTGQRATAELMLPWDDVPRDVRAGLIRDGGPVFQKWRAVK